MTNDPLQDPCDGYDGSLLCSHARARKRKQSTRHTRHSSKWVGSWEAFLGQVLRCFDGLEVGPVPVSGRTHGRKLCWCSGGDRLPAPKPELVEFREEVEVV